MMRFVILGALVACALARTEREERNMFADFKATYGRRYEGAAEEHRFRCFSTNLKLIDEHNARGAETHGVNQFADLCTHEFNSMYLGYKRANKTHYKHRIPFNGESVEVGSGSVPSSGSVVSSSSPSGSASGSSDPAPDAKTIDWRSKGAVTPVKNQGQCGSCWSFSATGSMEGQWMLAGNTLIGLSEEELVQCDHNGDEGCNGGIMDNAFEWVVSNKGIDSEANYPYTSGDGITGKCKTAKEKKVVATFTGHTDLPNDETAMGNWVYTNGPLSIAVDASSGWQSYTGGIVRNCFGTQLDHGVLIVGYDDNNSPPYWIVKNSWAASWGENGYIRLEKGTNQCGLNQDPCSAVATKKA